MKILKQLLFITVITICTSLAAYAQKQDEKRTPPKDKPPVVQVPDRKKDEKPKEGEKPRGDDRRNDNRGRRPEE
jgi:vacuolar-type H+-ATPase subunit F/Vma7